MFVVVDYWHWCFWREKTGLKKQGNQWYDLAIIYIFNDNCEGHFMLCASISSQFWAWGSICCLSPFLHLLMQIHESAGNLLRHWAIHISLLYNTNIGLVWLTFLWLLCQCLASWARLRSAKCWVVTAEQAALAEDWQGFCRTASSVTCKFPNWCSEWSLEFVDLKSEEETLLLWF